MAIEDEAGAVTSVEDSRLLCAHTRCPPEEEIDMWPICCGRCSVHEDVDGNGQSSQQHARTAFAPNDEARRTSPKASASLRLKFKGGRLCTYEGSSYSVLCP